MRRYAKTLLRSASDIVWPPRSLVSGKRGQGAGPLSADEFTALSFLTGPICDACGVPVTYDLGPGTHCAACIARPPRWQRARAALIYDDVSRRIVLDLKRTGRRDGLSLMAQWMARAAGPLLAEADLIVPVPLHYRRLVQRGFNQSAWLAQSLSRQSGVPCRVTALKRIKSTPSQGGLSARARRRNVAGAFKANRRQQLAGKRIALIDDVLTTGATLSACTKVLISAGAASVDVVVLARVVRDTDVTI